MFEIRKTLEIAGSHKLDLPYKSKCQRMHGHNWKILLYCIATDEQVARNNGMVVDFSCIKEKIHKILDHQHLNDISAIRDIGNPTAENIARWICHEIPECYKVEVEESSGNTAIYSDDNYDNFSPEEPESRVIEYVKSVCTQNPDGTWSSKGGVDLSSRGLKKLPVRFKEVSGYFYCYHNNLTSLEGAPKRVGRSFVCSYNNLTSLEGAPEQVGGDFDCSDNDLTSLEGAPKHVGRDFWCDNNILTSLEGAPKYVGEDFYCSDNLVSKEELRKTVDRPYL